MLKNLNNQRAQVISSEYVLVLFLVVGVVAAMSIYFQRAIQARMRDAQSTMAHVANDTVRDYYYEGNRVFLDEDFALWYQYEPYYLNTESDVSRESSSTQRIFPAAYGGQESWQDTTAKTSAQTQSRTAPPGDVDKQEDSGHFGRGN